MRRTSGGTLPGRSQNMGDSSGGNNCISAGCTPGVARSSISCAKIWNTYGWNSCTSSYIPEHMPLRPCSLEIKTLLHVLNRHAVTAVSYWQARRVFQVVQGPQLLQLHIATLEICEWTCTQPLTITLRIDFYLFIKSFHQLINHQ